MMTRKYEKIHKNYYAKFKKTFNNIICMSICNKYFLTAYASMVGKNSFRITYTVLFGNLLKN